MKTPEEMAEEYAQTIETCCGTSDIIIAAEAAFIAGYQAAKPQWISVKERLPEENVWVLGYYCRNKDEKFVVGSVQRFVHWWAGASIWMTDIVSDALSYEEVYSITHWQPLPEPPKEEK